MGELSTEQQVAQMVFPRLPGTLLSDDERAKLLADLKLAEAEIASGHYTELDAEAFRQRPALVR